MQKSSPENYLQLPRNCKKTTDNISLTYDYNGEFQKRVGEFQKIWKLQILRSAKFLKSKMQIRIYRFENLIFKFKFIVLKNPKFKFNYFKQNPLDSLNTQKLNLTEDKIQSSWFGEIQNFFEIKIH